MDQASLHEQTVRERRASRQRQTNRRIGSRWENRLRQNRRKGPEKNSARLEKERVQEEEEKYTVQIARGMRRLEATLGLAVRRRTVGQRQLSGRSGWRQRCRRVVVLRCVGCPAYVALVVPLAPPRRASDLMEVELQADHSGLVVWRCRRAGSATRVWVRTGHPRRSGVGTPMPLPAAVARGRGRNAGSRARRRGERCGRVLLRHVQQEQVAVDLSKLRKVRSCAPLAESGVVAQRRVQPVVLGNAREELAVEHESLVTRGHSSAISSVWLAHLSLHCMWDVICAGLRAFKAAGSVIRAPPPSSRLVSIAASSRRYSTILTY